MLFRSEAAFNLIRPVGGASVIDLVAGSGPLGLEAVSRGARRAVIVDANRDACRVINANLDKLGLHATVVCQDVIRALAAEGGTYDLVLCDPPYAYEGLDRLGPALRRLVAPGGLLVYQGPAREQPEIDGLTVRPSRTYGSARLTLFEP